jgi:hypothetical protein
MLPVDGNVPFKEGLDGRTKEAKTQRDNGLHIVNFVLASSAFRSIANALVCFKLGWAILSCMPTLAGVSAYVLRDHSDREAAGDDGGYLGYLDGDLEYLDGDLVNSNTDVHVL